MQLADYTQVVVKGMQHLGRALAHHDEAVEFFQVFQLRQLGAPGVCYIVGRKQVRGDVVLALQLGDTAGRVQEPGAEVARAHGRHAVVQQPVHGRALAFGAVVVVNDVELLERVVGQHHAVRAVFKRGFRNAVHQVRVVFVHEVQQVRERLGRELVRGKLHQPGFVGAEEPGHDLALVHLLPGFLHRRIGGVQPMDQPGAPDNSREV